MGDIVKRLRQVTDLHDARCPCEPCGSLAEIERLRAENERLRAANAQHEQDRLVFGQARCGDIARIAELEAALAEVRTAWEADAESGRERVAELEAAEHSAVERGNRLARQCQDQQARLKLLEADANQQCPRMVRRMGDAGEEVVPHPSCAVLTGRIAELEAALRQITELRAEEATLGGVARAFHAAIGVARAALEKDGGG